MVEGSSELSKARKAWRERNSSGKNCYDEAGELVECQPPPSFALSDVDLPAGMPAENRNVDEDSEYQRRAVKHEHVWGVEDPDDE